MILIDRRQGSADLADVWGDAELSDLTFADVAILGTGHDGVPVSIGIELKRLDELMADLHTGRFLGHQAPGMRREYDYCWLVVEGDCREGRKGELEVPKGRPSASGRRGWTQLQIGYQAMRYQTLLALLMTITQKAGIFVRQTKTRGQTLKFCQGLAAWWEKGWDQHQAMDRLYVAPHGPIPREHTLLERWLQALPGVGWKRSAHAERLFASPHALATASIEDLMAIKGVSRAKARTIYALINNIQEDANADNVQEDADADMARTSSAVARTSSAVVAR